MSKVLYGCHQNNHHRRNVVGIHNQSFNSKASVANMTSSSDDELLILLPSSDLVRFYVIIILITIHNQCCNEGDLHILSSLSLFLSVRKWVTFFGIIATFKGRVSQWTLKNKTLRFPPFKIEMGISTQICFVGLADGHTPIWSSTLIIVSRSPHGHINRQMTILGNMLKTVAKLVQLGITPPWPAHVGWLVFDITHWYWYWYWYNILILI